ncbi:hypothetical protein K2173_024659 [Erythroxylum novogranatense]|uniref:non-specific serine/threonine protein kinase n=1 Tax=Erythroxylum novogranatense TaxID=1862640 RepID=A0AAV8SUW8_9ROSI|nr:hypothetical protein K2173_024659 [Erythroxylum novogranatense]
MLQHLLFIFLCVLAPAVPGHGQNQTGFISIDCGLPANGSYTDSKTGLDYISDETFIDSGIRASIGPDFNINGTDTQLLYLRSFPQGGRNCYNISVTGGTKYLIRARFLYGNYDNLNKLPIFDVHIGPNKLVNVQILNASVPVNTEFIYNPSSNYMFVCLVNVGSGIPFISALEFRPLNSTAYPIRSGQQVLFLRKDVGSRTNKQFRFPDDVYDRIWDPYHLMKSTDLSTNITVEPDPQHIEYQLPSNVMRTAESPTNTSAPVNFSISVGASGYNFYVCMHFAEIVKLEANQSRQFDINIQYQMDQLNTNLNTRNWIPSLVPHYLSSTTICTLSTGTLITFLIDKTEASTLPPLLNALEIYYIVEFTQAPTDPSDVVAISEIKSMYKVTKNWQGDPCAPQAYVWDGLNCSYNNAQPTITSLSLSFSALTGEIAPEIANLKSLESLDLSNNNLNGSIPDFLSQLSSLKVLNLAGNNLTGAVPVALIQRSQQGSLLLSVDGNANLCTSISCNNKNNNKNNVVAPVVASVAAFFVIVSLVTIFWSRKRRQQAKKTEAENSKTNERLELNRRQFSYSEILIITNNFEKVLGKGGFGTVYHGFLDDTQVAVKVLSPSSRQGYKQFEAEVKLLLRVHHRNLTTLVGYCYEDTNMALIYEFMANGNLEDHLSDKNKETLSWELRLQIALDAAQGLEYLHNGCKPPIVHRDVKTTNILLDDKLRAKISDFGLSRSFLVEDDSHVSTTVAGTPGYLDPEIHGTNWFTEKTDVYSFGVVLLKIITNQPVIARASENIHITQCVTPLITNGDIETIVDHRLSGAYSVNSVWKFMELAMDCVYSNAMRRPNMSQVVIELTECLAMERYRIMEGQSFQTENPSEVFSMNLHTGESPLAR